LLVEITRTFVRLREILATHAELARRLNELEKMPATIGAWSTGARASDYTEAIRLNPKSAGAYNN